MRARYQMDDNVSPQNFNGTFTQFSGGLAPVLDATGQPVLNAGQPGCWNRLIPSSAIAAR